MDRACTDIDQYKASDTLATDVANVTAILQSFCMPYQSSGNSTPAMDFANVLAAIQVAAVLRL
jgi:hypothetical protein